MFQELEPTLPIPHDTLSKLRDACEGMSSDTVWLDSRTEPRRRPRGDQVSELLADAESRTSGLPILGMTHYGSGMRAAFELEVVASTSGSPIIAGASFRVSACVALVAYCEWLASRARGLTVSQAFCLEVSDLVSGIPAIPRPWHPRAELAVVALRSALLAAARTPAGGSPGVTENP